jgi:hypothetical protein
MTYTVTLPNGSTLGTISDGTGNGPAFPASTAFTSLNLIGRNYSNYGQFIANDLVALLVNNAYSVSPSTPQQGQLWYDTSNSLLKIYNGTAWVVVSAATSQATAPSTTVAGSFWWDSVNQQLYVYNGLTPYNISGWILVGPQRNGSGAVWEVIYDTGLNAHDVLSLKLDGVRTAIISSSSFTSNVSYPGIGTNIVAGYNVSSSYTIYGTANNASYLGAVPAANYLRTDINNVAQGSLAIQSNTGVIIGSLGTLVANVTTSGTGRLYNVYSGGNISFHVNSTLNGQEKSLWVSGYDGYTYVNADPIGAMGVATKNYVDNSFVNATLSGVSTAVTAPLGTANTMIATTAFVVNNSGFFTNKIYQGNSYLQILDTGAGNITLNIDSANVLTATSTGVNLLGAPTTVTASQVYNDSGSSAVASTQYVKTATQWWGGSAKFVSNAAPNPGVNDTGSNNGDFWFQISS